MKRMSNRTKNTSFSTDPGTFRLAKSLAVLEDVSLSELVDRALKKELTYLLKKHKQNQKLASFLTTEEEAIAG
jgi:hypothetical protein